MRRKDDIGPTRWVTVPVVPNTFVVNVGDLMHVLSNEWKVPYCVAPGHCKQNKSTTIGCKHFFSPSMDLMVGPVSKLTGSKQGPIYKSVSCMGYLKLEKKYAVISKNCRDSAFPNPTINLSECTSLKNS